MGLVGAVESSQLMNDTKTTTEEHPKTVRYRAVESTLPMNDATCHLGVPAGGEERD